MPIRTLSSGASLPRSPTLPITLACAASLALAALVLTLGDARGDAQTYVALAVTWSAAAACCAWSVGGQPQIPKRVLLTAIGLRILALATEPTLSDDVYRYLWEGRVLAAGLDPFQLPPNAPELAHLRDAIWGLVNHRDVSTIYPPLALALFELVARLAPGALAWKTLAGLADLTCLALIALLARRRGVGAWAPTLWALLPLPVLESAGSGHLESLAIAPLLLGLVLAERRPIAASAAATFGSLVKLLPLALLAPLLARRSTGSRAGAVAMAGGLWALAVLPWLDTGHALGRGFGRYYESWAFNGSLFPLLEALTGDPGVSRALGTALGALVCAWALWRRPDPAVWLLWAFGALVLLSPVVHPWYLLWPLAPALITGAWPWAVLAATVQLSYLVLGSYDQTSSAWVETWWIPWVEYPPLVLAAWHWHRTRRRPSAD